MKIPIVSNLPELPDKLKIQSLTIVLCISLDVNVSRIQADQAALGLFEN